MAPPRSQPTQPAEKGPVSPLKLMPSGAPTPSTPDQIAAANLPQGTFDIATDINGNPAAPGQGYYGPPIPASSGGATWVQAFWGGLGLDAATIAGLTKAVAGLTDPTEIQLIGQNYLRTTAWYQQTFPGFAAGVQAGLYTDETGYRSYVNQLNQASQQYLGRAVTGAEVTAALQGGVNPSLYAGRLQGNALAQTLGPEAQYEAGAFTSQGRLSQQDLQSYGQEQAGIDTPQGQLIQQRLQDANKRMQTLFTGTLAKANLSLGVQGVFSSGLQNSAQRGSQATQADLPT